MASVRFRSVRFANGDSHFGPFHRPHVCASVVPGIYRPNKTSGRGKSSEGMIHVHASPTGRACVVGRDRRPRRGIIGPVDKGVRLLSNPSEFHLHPQCHRSTFRHPEEERRHLDAPGVVARTASGKGVRHLRHPLGRASGTADLWHPSRRPDHLIEREVPLLLGTSHARGLLPDRDAFECGHRRRRHPYHGGDEEGLDAEDQSTFPIWRSQAEVSRRPSSRLMGS